MSAMQQYLDKDARVEPDWHDAYRRGSERQALEGIPTHALDQDVIAEMLEIVRYLAPRNEAMSVQARKVLDLMGERYE